VQLETEKVNVDVAADSSGVLGTIQHREGDTVHPGDVLALLEPAAASAAPMAAAAAPNSVAAAPTSAAAPPPPVEDRAHASPVARRMAEEHGVDLNTIEGTGTGGRVTREDVERLISRTDGAPPAAAPAAP